MADFITEFSPSQGKLDVVDGVKRWVVNVDGSSTFYAGGIGVIELYLNPRKETS